MPPRPLTERLLDLSRFDGDAGAAVLAVHAFLAPTYPDCALALMLVRGEPRGSARLAGLVDADGLERVPGHDPFGERRTLARVDDTLAAQLFGDDAAKAIGVPSTTSAPLLDLLGGARALLATPVASAGVIDHWLVLASPDPARFADVDVERFALEANLAANLILRPLATRGLREETTRQRLAIEGLADVQKLLLPESPAIRGLDYAIHWQPAETAAGDYYDLMPLTHYFDEPALAESGRDVWAVMLADVSGHGAAAAMEAVQFDAILRTYVGDADDDASGPAGALTYANRYFFSRRTRHHFLTAFALMVHPLTREARYVSAGHPPLLQRRGDTVTLRGAGEQIPVGIVRDHVFDDRVFDVAPGDVLVLHTDGIVEARDATGTPFGMPRLEALVREGPTDPDALLASIRTALHAHQGGPLGTDDQTVIVLRLG